MSEYRHPPRPAVLFDIDGTLIDSNYLHVEAWSRALFEVGRPADAWRVHGAIGLDSAKLLAALLGDDVSQSVETDAKQRHSRYLAESAYRLRPFDRARELLREVAARDLQVVLATSAPAGELERLLRALDSEDVLSHVTSAEDVETAKPDPDIILTALAKAGVDASAAIMVGDAVWDVEAAARAGVPCVAVRTGGTAAEVLLGAGAVAVYDDVAALLSDFDQSPLAAL